jgi:Transposase, Mutator family
MKNHTTQADSATLATTTAAQLFDDWFDPIEFGVRNRVRDFIQTMMEEELEALLSRPRYGRIAATASKESGTVTGHRHGHRLRSLLGTFGPVEVAMPRARLNAPEGGTTEWKSKALKAYQRRAVAADAVIAGAYLALDREQNFLSVAAHSKHNESEIAVALRSSLTRTTVPSRMSRADRLVGERVGVPGAQSVFTLRQVRLTVSLLTAPRNRAVSARRTRRVLVPEHGRRKRRGLAQCARRSY